MPDNTDQPDRAEGAGVTAGGLGLGDRLRSARKARAISLERVAEALNLDESVVLHLEHERFEELGAPVFVRGHLKAYARLVGLSESAVLEAYGASVEQPVTVTVTPATRSVGRQVTINPVVWGVSSLVVLLGILLAAYVLLDDGGAPVTVAAPTVPAASPVGPAADSASAAAQPPLPVDAPVATVSEPPEQFLASGLPAAAPVPEATPADDIAAEERPVAAEEPTRTVARPPAELMRLSLHFREESWVEISDANRRLLFGLQREGRRRELSGEPPFRLLIGNASGVELSVNDEPYDMPESGVTGKVARFEIDARASE
jgi:cytoskeleton protein RodZ